MSAKNKKIRETEGERATYCFDWKTIFAGGQKSLLMLHFKVLVTIKDIKAGIGTF